MHQPPITLNLMGMVYVPFLVRFFCDANSEMGKISKKLYIYLAKMMVEISTTKNLALKWSRRFDEV